MSEITEYSLRDQACKHMQIAIIANAHGESARFQEETDKARALVQQAEALRLEGKIQ